MNAALIDTLTFNRLQPMSFSSRQGLQGPLPNSLGVYPKIDPQLHQTSFGSAELLTQSLPTLIVQLVVQRRGVDAGAVRFGNLGIKTVVSQQKVRTEKVFKTYSKNGILVRHTGKRISSEDVANALAEE